MTGETTIQWCPDEDEFDRFETKAYELGDRAVTIGLIGGRIILMGPETERLRVAAWIEGYVEGRRDAA